MQLYVIIKLLAIIKLKEKNKQIFLVRIETVWK